MNTVLFRAPANQRCTTRNARRYGSAGRAGYQRGMVSQCGRAGCREFRVDTSSRRVRHGGRSPRLRRDVRGDVVAHSDRATTARGAGAAGPCDDRAGVPAEQGHKDLWQVERPCRTLADVATIAACPEHGSWSGAAAVAIAWSGARVGWGAVGVALFAAASRVFVGVHYPHRCSRRPGPRRLLALSVPALARVLTPVVADARAHATAAWLVGSAAPETEAGHARTVRRRWADRSSGRHRVAPRRRTADRWADQPRTRGTRAPRLRDVERRDRRASTSTWSRAR
jgi:hypothetical protein